MSDRSQSPGPRVLLAGKHELACRLLELLRDEPRVRRGVVLARSETIRPGREALKAAVSDEDNVIPDDGAVSLAEAVRAFQPAVLISAGFDRIVKREVLDAVPHPLNIHFGRLPKYRGNWSIPWAILNDDDVIGVTLHRMAPGIDDGSIVHQATVPNDRSRSCRELYEKAIDGGTTLFRQWLDSFVAGSPPPDRPQDETAATYYSPEYPGQFRIPWKQITTYVRNYIRAAHFPPMGGARTAIDGVVFEIEWPVDEVIGAPAGPPGTIIGRDGRFWIATLNGHVGPNVVRHEGRQESFVSFAERYRAAGKRCA